MDLDTLVVRSGTMIAIEGNIGSGKSSLINAIPSWFERNVLSVPEPIDEWTKGGETNSALGKFYSSPEKHAMDFQVFVASSKFRDLSKKIHAFASAGNDPTRPGSVYCERDPFDVDIFPRLNLEEGLFDESQVDVMKHLVDTFRVTGTVPSVVASIYMRAEPSLCMKRVLLRGRPEEADGGVSLDRLTRIHALHEIKFGGDATRENVLILDASAPIHLHKGVVLDFIGAVSDAVTTARARTSSGDSLVL